MSQSWLLVGAATGTAAPDQTIQIGRNANWQIIQVQNSPMGSTKVFLVKPQDTITGWKLQLEERNCKVSESILFTTQILSSQ